MHEVANSSVLGKLMYEGCAGILHFLFPCGNLSMPDTSKSRYGLFGAIFNKWDTLGFLCL